jgi:hypothetical protein
LNISRAVSLFFYHPDSSWAHVQQLLRLCPELPKIPKEYFEALQSILSEQDEIECEPIKADFKGKPARTCESSRKIYS